MFHRAERWRKAAAIHRKADRDLLSGCWRKPLPRTTAPTLRAIGQNRKKSLRAYLESSEGAAALKLLEACDMSIDLFNITYVVESGVCFRKLFLTVDGLAFLRWFPSVNQTCWELVEEKEIESFIDPQLLIDDIRAHLDHASELAFKAAAE